jgi:hypothetical protein
MTPRHFRCSFCIALLGLVATACHTAPPIAAEQPAATVPAPVQTLRSRFGPFDARIPGTYDLLVCAPGACAPHDTTAAHFAATVVLMDSVEATRLGHLIPGDAYTMFNGCFHAYHNRRRAGSLLGLDTAGLMFWHPDLELGASTAFDLFESPDAGYVVRVVPSAVGLVGHGFSVAFLGSPSDRDTVVAVRVGDADVSICRTIQPPDVRAGLALPRDRYN